MRAALQPREVQRRHQAVMNLWNSRRVRDAADAPCLAAGFSPAGPANTPALCKNFPPVCREAAPADFLRSPGVRLVVSYEYARRWAVANGLCQRRHAMDLKAVNAARRDKGLVLFVLKGPE